jgi:hypothetical protein
MYELIAIATMVLCLGVIGFALKVYKESPKLKDNFPDDPQV